MAAGKKLKNYKFKIRNHNGTFSNLNVNKETFLVHPNFRINSYDKRRFLINDVAIVSIQTHQDLKSAKLDMKTQSATKNYGNFIVTDSHECDKIGLSESQQCLKSKVKEQKFTKKNSVGNLFEHIQFDPREGYYSSSCFYKSGKPIFDNMCHLVAMSLLSNCEESILVALNLEHLKKWIRITITTDIVRNQKWKKHKFLKRLFINELKEGSQCGKNLQPNNITKVMDTTLNNKIIQATPTFKRLSENLRVITSCGVEIRLNTGMIHSPIHYRDVQNSKELLSLFQKDYRYRPNQKCEWLITAPTKNQKVGIQFNYFDLDPEFDRLEIEVILHIYISLSIQNEPIIKEDGEDFSLLDVARFKGGQIPRPIISGSDQLRLTFYSDYERERRGFALTFQPVNVTQCGGEYFAVSGNVQSPNYPFFYPPNAVCIWKIQVTFKELIYIIFFFTTF